LASPFKAAEKQKVMTPAPAPVAVGAGTGPAPAFAGSFQSFFDEPAAPVTRFQPSPASPERVLPGEPTPGRAPWRVTIQLGEMVPIDRSLGVRWRWPHLIAFGACAWGLPTFLGSKLISDKTVSGILDGMLVTQILGYVAAVIMAYLMVRLFQGGDWSSLGLSQPADSGAEILQGAGFGLLLLGACTVLTLLLSGGHFRLDQMVRTLVGETSGVGLLLAGVVTVIGAPIVEEIYFRGMLYEKLARTSSGLAIGLTSVLFVTAHGSPFILPLYFLAIGAAVMRRTKTLWFTIAAHAAWNLAVICMAAFVLFSPSKVFTPDDGAYSVTHPPSWQRMEDAEQQMPNGSIDLALQSDNGSYLIVERVGIAVGAQASSVVKMVDKLMQGSGVPMTSHQPPHRSSALGGAWEVGGQVSTPEGNGKMRVLALLPLRQTRAILFMFVCPDASCAVSEPQFDKFLASFHLNSV
jgi:membrane protease YdiL (CAAX protease family)